MAWLHYLLTEYALRNQINAGAERIQILEWYFISQKYNTLDIACDALIADSKVDKILLGLIDA